MSNEPFDIVYTWVDDAFPGYQEMLSRYADTSHDTNPNRTRDNLDLLKYSLRSIEAFAPNFRNLYIVTCAPQIPHWLNPEASGLNIVHHDAFMDADALPTFSSFAITTYLSRLPGISRRFLYVEDDMLFGRPFLLSDFLSESGQLRVYRRLTYTCAPHKQHRDDLSPWNTSLAYSNHLLDAVFGAQRRRHHVNHVPLLIHRDHWEDMIARWPEDFARTHKSRFRVKYNVVPVYLYPYFLLYTGRAACESAWRTYTATYYRAIENLLPLTWTAFAGIRLFRPKMITLGDNFGEQPNPSVVAMSRRFLEETYPKKSRYEL